MAITKQQIFDIANRLDAEGKAPTLAAVRKELGGGSYTTISEAMTEWKAAKLAKESTVREAAPPAVAERLAELGVDIWAVALEMANERLAAEREALAQARTQLEAEKAEAAELADTLQAELEQVHAHAQELQAARDQALQERQRARDEIVKLTERAVTAEARADETSRRADDLNAELARVNAQNAELVRALADAAKAGGKGGEGRA